MASVQLPPRWGRFFEASPEGTTVEFVGIEAFRHVGRAVIGRSQSPISRRERRLAGRDNRPRWRRGP